MRSIDFEFKEIITYILSTMPTDSLGPCRRGGVIVVINYFRPYSFEKSMAGVNG
jgi:hypothetical protein